MKKFYIKTTVILSFALLLMLSFSTTKKVFASNENIQNAQTVNIGEKWEGEFITWDEVFYYKFKVPENIGNCWVNFNLYSQVTHSIDIDLCDEFGRGCGGASYVRGIGKNSTGVIRTGVTGAKSQKNNLYQLEPGKIYYLKIQSFYNGNVKGKYELSISKVEDDNWGTTDKAPEIACDKEASGTLEYSDDIDCYAVTLPNDGLKHNFVFNTTGTTDVVLYNSDGVEIGDTRIQTNEANNKLTLTGQGQKVYIEFRNQSSSPNPVTYKFKVVTQASAKKTANNPKKISEQKTVSVLKLTKYKKNSKKLSGKTVKSASVKVKIGKKTYKVKADKKGNFSIKLSKKLKSKQKIVITISKANYKTKKVTFRVK